MVLNTVDEPSIRKMAAQRLLLFDRCLIHRNSSTQGCYLRETDDEEPTASESRPKMQHQNKMKYSNHIIESSLQPISTLFIIAIIMLLKLVITSLALSASARSATAAASSNSNTTNAGTTKKIVSDEKCLTYCADCFETCVSSNSFLNPTKSELNNQNKTTTESSTSLKKTSLAPTKSVSDFYCI